MLNITQDEINKALSEKAFIKKWEAKNYENKLEIILAIQKLRSGEGDLRDLPPLIKSAVILSLI
jgi:hypothetical protein